MDATHAFVQDLQQLVSTNPNISVTDVNRLAAVHSLSDPLGLSDLSAPLASKIEDFQLLTVNDLKEKDKVKAYIADYNKLLKKWLLRRHRDGDGKVIEKGNGHVVIRVGESPARFYNYEPDSTLVALFQKG
ncbi:hypothetical protein GCM10028806_34590 [Spirosoma terrae]|uniref:Uncharacterized protein n=1 Tax=Spirosoma terrae TaxID=1968276 RepID=A0A6L9LAD5_9BACT|nr:hypothetical protein [Spirosoma terrae]NDU95773.1 hypothetical protein [Spirosoma terrae]